MTIAIARSPTFWIAGAILLSAGSLSTRGSGVASGVSSVPANASRQLSSCAQCHSGSAPVAGRTNGPSVSLSAAKLVLQANETTTVTTAAVGGVAGTTGGFLCETTAGTFTAGANSRVNTGNTSITHSNNSARSWSFSFTAPSAPGPVELTTAGLTSNGSGSSGDRFSFSGFDNNATVGTPVRVFVLPSGVQVLGTGCPDGYGNQSVLGATSAPLLGNAAFGFQMVGAAPGSFSLAWHTINPAGFPGIDLGGVLGMFGCTAYVLNPIIEQSGLTTAGNAQRAEGTMFFPLPLPMTASLSGLTFQSQAGYLDPSAVTRATPASVTNGLATTIQ